MENKNIKVGNLVYDLNYTYRVLHVEECYGLIKVFAKQIDDPTHCILEESRYFYLSEEERSNRKTYEDIHKENFEECLKYSNKVLNELIKYSYTVDQPECIKVGDYVFKYDFYDKELIQYKVIFIDKETNKAWISDFDFGDYLCDLSSLFLCPIKAVKSSIKKEMEKYCGDNK